MAEWARKAAEAIIKAVEAAPSCCPHEDWYGGQCFPCWIDLLAPLIEQAARAMLHKACQAQAERIKELEAENQRLKEGVESVGRLLGSEIERLKARLAAFERVMEALRAGTVRFEEPTVITHELLPVLSRATFTRIGHAIEDSPLCRVCTALAVVEARPVAAGEEEG